MSPPGIYKSAYPDYVVPRQSVYSRLFPKQPLYDELLPAFIDATTGRTLTRRDMQDLSLCMAHGVRQSLKVKRGDIVMLFSPNSLTWPIALYGCIAAGLRCTLVNSSYTPSELAHQLKDSGAEYVFVHPTLLPILFQAFKALNVTMQEAERRVILMNFEEKPLRGTEKLVHFDSLLRQGKRGAEENFDGDQSNETVCLCYSSGTTGLSKGVETTHHNINTVLICARAAFPAMYPRRDVMLGILPFYHMYGAVKILLYSFTLGVPVVISPPFDPEGFCSNIQKYKITYSLIVPPVLVALASHPAVDNYDLSSLRILFSAAAPLGKDLIARVQARLRTRRANVVVPQGYGLTETSPTVLVLSEARADEKVGSAGELLPNMEIRLMREDGRDVREGEPGELWLRAESVMKGYLNNPTATANSITSGGWFKTGDVAIRDKDGFYTIVDRLKELIKYKGFQVPPADLEGVLLTHPDIVDAGVIGVYSEEQGTELPRAYIVHRHEFSSLSQGGREQFSKEVQSWIQEKVAKHKFLRGGVVVIEAIPKSPAGKILRRQLRDLAKQEMAEAGMRAKL